MSGFSQSSSSFRWEGSVVLSVLESVPCFQGVEESGWSQSMIYNLTCPHRFYVNVSQFFLTYPTSTGIRRKNERTLLKKVNFGSVDSISRISIRLAYKNYNHHKALLSLLWNTVNPCSPFKRKAWIFLSLSPYTWIFFSLYFTLLIGIGWADSSSLTPNIFTPGGEDMRKPYHQCYFPG